MIRTLLFSNFLTLFVFSLPAHGRILDRKDLNDTFITKLKYYNIQLIQSNDTSALEFTPIYKNRKVLINDSFCIELDSVCSGSNLFNDAFSLRKYSIKILRENKHRLTLIVSLWQAGCSGSFCSDMVQIKIDLNHETIKVKSTDVFGKDG